MHTNQLNTSKQTEHCWRLVALKSSSSRLLNTEYWTLSSSNKQRRICNHEQQTILQKFKLNLKVFHLTKSFDKNGTFIKNRKIQYSLSASVLVLRLAFWNPFHWMAFETKEPVEIYLTNCNAIFRSILFLVQFVVLIYCIYLCASEKAKSTKRLYHKFTLLLWDMSLKRKPNIEHCTDY